MISIKKLAFNLLKQGAASFFTVSMDSEILEFALFSSCICSTN